MRNAMLAPTSGRPSLKHVRTVGDSWLRLFRRVTSTALGQSVPSISESSSPMWIEEESRELAGIGWRVVLREFALEQALKDRPQVERTNEYDIQTIL